MGLLAPEDQIPRHVPLLNLNRLLLHRPLLGSSLRLPAILAVGRAQCLHLANSFPWSIPTHIECVSLLRAAGTSLLVECPARQRRLTHGLEVGTWLVGLFALPLDHSLDAITVLLQALHQVPLAVVSRMFVGSDASRITGVPAVLEAQECFLCHGKRLN